MATSKYSGENGKDDPLFLQNSDHPGMNLTSSLLTGNNYLTWSCSVKIALGAKTKLGFIDKRCKPPDEKDAKYEQWHKVDCMVRSWILNSIAKDIVEAFLYVNTTKDFWDKLKYQIQREISTVTQGNLTVAQYYTKLKKYRDELNCLTLVSECACGVAKVMSDTIDSSRLVQFLMGLNDIYDSISGQVLLTEPLPNVNKAYSLVLRVEKQREVNQIYDKIYTQENRAFLVKTQQGQFARGRGGNQTRGHANQARKKGRGAD